MNYIYNLSVFNPLSSTYEIFYIGRTNDPERRKREHQYAVKKDKHTVYQTIRLIEKNKLKWDLFVVKAVQDYQSEEKDYIIKVILEDQFSKKPKKLVKSLYKLDNIVFTNVLSNEKLGDSSPELKRYKEMKETMKKLNFTKVHQLTEHEARLKTKALHEKVLAKQDESINPRTMKERIQASNKYKELVKEAIECHKQSKKSTKNLLKGIMR